MTDPAATRVTIVLSRLGLDAFGVDLSPGMIALAQQTYPDLRSTKEGAPRAYVIVRKS